MRALVLVLVSDELRCRVATVAANTAASFARPQRSFVCDALPVSLIGMNKESMATYVEFCADRLCTALAVKKMYNARNPFEWMELISLQGKTNFFEKRVSEYQKSGVMGGGVGGEGGGGEMDFNADF